MNFQLSSILLRPQLPTHSIQSSIKSPIQSAESVGSSISRTPVPQLPELGPIFDGGRLPGGCFACGLAFSGQFGEQFLGQFFGL